MSSLVLTPQPGRILSPPSLPTLCAREIPVLVNTEDNSEWRVKRCHEVATCTGGEMEDVWMLLPDNPAKWPHVAMVMEVCFG